MDRANRRPRSAHVLDASPGLYALFLGPDISLPGFSLAPGSLIYIGKAEGAGGLKRRCHFRGGTRNHSPRKSLAVILRDQLRLVPQRVVQKDGQYKTWELDRESERVLDEWMHANLEVSVLALRETVASEKALISKFAPILNLTDCVPSPDHLRISRGRRLIESKLRDM